MIVLRREIKPKKNRVCSDCNSIITYRPNVQKDDGTINEAFVCSNKTCGKICSINRTKSKNKSKRFWPQLGLFDSEKRESHHIRYVILRNKDYPVKGFGKYNPLTRTLKKGGKIEHIGRKRHEFLLTIINKT